MIETPKIEQVSVEKLIPYAANSRTHSDAQVAQIAASIKEFGWTNPILVSGDNSIIAGHGRLLAARKLGMDEVPTIVLDHLSKAQQRALVIADNQLALNAGWDMNMLKAEIEDLNLENFNLELLGFDDDFLDGLLETAPSGGNTDEDAVPEVPETPKTVLGDVWVLGNHRLMCGDSTSIDAVDKLMNGTKADMVFTDPPYGMSYSGGRGKHETWKGGNKRPAVLNDGLEGEGLLTLLRDSLTSAKIYSKSGAAAYVCFPWRTYAEFEASVEDAGFKVNACIVWDKKSIGLGKSHFRPQHEFIFYSQGESWFGGKGESDVWYMTRGNTSAYVHPTQKPIELVERALNNSSKGGDIVIDCFGGSGSTLIACEKTNRHSHLMELEPKYCDVIIKRWQDFSGKVAIHAETGEAFDG